MHIRKAFTLIELLVVIAIIAILAAILFPVFAQAKLAAKKTQDLSNNKQILLGCQMYTVDYDDVLPMIRNGASNWQNPVTGEQINSGHNAVNPYIKNRSLWLSPNDTMPRCDATSTGYFSPSIQSNPTGGGISYVFSYYVSGSTTSFGIGGRAIGATVYSNSFSTTAVGAPANTIWLIPSYISWSYWNGLMQYRADQRQYAFDPSVWSGGLATWPNVTSASGAWCSTQDAMSVGAYGGITNWGFADGHAKSMKRDQIMDRTWVTDLTTAIATNKKNLIHYDEKYK